MKPLATVLVAAFTVVAPAAAFAATYEYVTTQGTLATVEANSASEALMNASGIASNSGVALWTSGSVQTMQPGATPAMSSGMSAKANEFKQAFRDLLTDHVEYSIDALRAIEDNDDSRFDDARDDQDMNAEDIGGAVGSIYGTDAGDMFTDMFKEHIVSSNEYTQALVDEDDDAADEALDELMEYLTDISAFLAGANPNIDEDVLLDALTEHEELLNRSSEAYIDGDMDEADDLEDEAIAQIIGGADYLSSAIIEQFPEKF